jgi:D-inositol-3-phosphate glycosyltransferase
MRVTLVGPAYPWRGGLPLLVTDLAHRLAAEGHAVRVRTWTHQGPARLLPAQALTAAEGAVYPAEPVLSWRNPIGGWRAGRAAAASDLVIVVHYTTIQAPVLWAVARAAHRGARVVAICANVVPHEARPGDGPLTALLMRAVDAAVVHTEAERRALAALTGRPVAVAPLPPHLPEGPPRPGAPGVRRRLLFFGKVRRYKGLDVLLRALAQLDGVHLTVAGEVYPDARDLDGLVDRLGLRDRVDIRPGYLPAERIPDLFASVDALVLPYRSATASQHVALANRHRVPVVATRVGNFPDVIDDGVDGLLCSPGDIAALTRALRELYRPGRLDALRAAAPVTDDELLWKTYLETLLTVDGDDRRMARGRSAAGRFARLNRWEADLVERRLAIPSGPPPAPLLQVSVLANGSKLWFAIATAMALRPGLRRAAYEGVVAVLLATGTTQVLNRLVDRPRPPADSPARRALAHQPTAPSFPSSHTAAATAFTTAVARRNPWIAAALAPLAGTLAYGRVRLRAHWPTDVLGGVAVGVGAGRLARSSATAICSACSRTRRPRSGPHRRRPDGTGIEEDQMLHSAENGEPRVQL